MPHICRTFEALATVRGRLEDRADRLYRTRHLRSRYAIRSVTARASEALKKAADAGRITHRCRECKRWVSVTSQSFRPHATHAELTRFSAAERQVLGARPVVLTVWNDADAAACAKILPKLPALGFDVVSECGPNVRGPGQAPLRRTSEVAHNPA